MEDVRCNSNAKRKLSAVQGVPAFRCSAEFKHLSDAGAAVARSLELPRVAVAAAAFARSAELKRLSGIAAAIRPLELPRVAVAAAAFAHSAELKRLSGIAAAIRPLELPRVAVAAAAFARSAELKRLSGIAAAIRPLQLSRITISEDAFAHLAKTKVSFPQLVTELRSNADGHAKAEACLGLKSDCEAIPQAGYKGISISAEFRLSFASTPIPQAVESSEPNTVFNSQYWKIFTQLEQTLRQLVAQRLETLAGSNWIRQRVPQELSRRWEKRMEKDRADGRQVYSAVQYSDFMDLVVVIKRNDNWREVFQEIFRNQNEIEVSFQRLHRIRNAVAHSRPLSRVDVLTLVSESAYIFRALGVGTLH